MAFCYSSGPREEVFSIHISGNGVLPHRTRRAVLLEDSRHYHRTRGHSTHLISSWVHHCDWRSCCTECRSITIPFVIVLSNSSSGMTFQLRAASEQEFRDWTDALAKECNGEKSFPYPLPIVHNNTTQKNRSNALRKKPMYRLRSGKKISYRHY